MEGNTKQGVEHYPANSSSHSKKKVKSGFRLMESIQEEKQPESKNDNRKRSTVQINVRKQRVSRSESSTDKSEKSTKRLDLESSRTNNTIDKKREVKNYGTKSTDKFNPRTAPVSEKSSDILQSNKKKKPNSRYHTVTLVEHASQSTVNAASRDKVAKNEVPKYSLSSSSTKRTRKSQELTLGYTTQSSKRSTNSPDRSPTPKKFQTRKVIMESSSTMGKTSIKKNAILLPERPAGPVPRKKRSSTDYSSTNFGQPKRDTNKTPPPPLPPERRKDNFSGKVAKYLIPTPVRDRQVFDRRSDINSVKNGLRVKSKVSNTRRDNSSNDKFSCNNSISVAMKMNSQNQQRRLTSTYNDLKPRCAYPKDESRNQSSRKKVSSNVLKNAINEEKTKTTEPSRIPSSKGVSNQSRSLPSQSGSSPPRTIKTSVRQNRIYPLKKVNKGLLSEKRKNTKRLLLAEDESKVAEVKRCRSNPGSREGFVWCPSSNIIERNLNISNTSLPPTEKNVNCDDMEEFSFWKQKTNADSALELKLQDVRKVRSALLNPVAVTNKSERSKESAKLASWSLPSEQLAQLMHKMRHSTEWNEVNVEPGTDQKTIDVANWVASVTNQTISTNESDRDSEITTRSERTNPRSCTKEKSSFGVTGPKRKRISPVREKPWCFSMTDSLPSKRSSKSSLLGSTEQVKLKTKTSTRRVNSNKLLGRKYYYMKDRRNNKYKNSWSVMVPVLTKSSSSSKAKLLSGGLLTRKNYEKVVESMKYKDTEGLTLVLVPSETKENARRDKESSSFDYERKMLKNENSVFTIGFVRDKDIENSCYEIESSSTTPVVLELAESSGHLGKKHKCDLLVEESAWVCKMVKSRPFVLRKRMMEYSRYVKAKTLSSSPGQKKEADIWQEAIKDTNDTEMTSVGNEQNYLINNRKSEMFSAPSTDVITKKTSILLAGVSVLACLFLIGTVFWNKVTFVV